MKKILLIIALLISALGLNAQTLIGNLYFGVTNYTSAECEVSGYSGEPVNVIIPSKVTISGKEYTVTSIEEWAFYECSSLTSIEIPSSVTSIGEDAFSWCSSLTSIEIPSGVTSIGEGAFGGCSSLTSIEIPSGVTSIGDNAFMYCESLTSIDFGENSQLTSIGDEAFYLCSSLTSIELPNGVTSIGYETFAECSSLTSIELPSSVTSIGDGAFFVCSSLTSIEIPSGVTSIGYYAFSGCSSLTSIVVESGNTVYDSRDNCNAIIETATNTLIAGCQNTVIPNSVTFIGNNAFSYCDNLTSIEIPSGVTSIGYGAFRECSGLTSIDFGENSQLTSIGEDAFVGCSSLTSIEIPSGVTSIGDFAFSGCSSLTSIEFGENSQLTSIGNYAFYDCSSLTSIYCYAENVPQTWIDAFNGCPSDMVIYVPEQSVDAYKAASPWNEYTILAMPNYEIAAVIAPSESGVVTGAGTYNHGEEITLTATANEGYKFINWTENGEVVSTEAEYSFVITGDRNLVANFVTLHEVTASVNDENFGAVTGADTYSHGEEVTLTATANEGYKFVNWTENDTVVSTEAEYSFVITGDRNLVANFVTLHEVTASVNDENFGSVAGAGIYGYGEEVTLTATANEGYKFVNWTENDTVVSTEAEYSFVITGDRNLVANFELLTYEVVASVNDENFGAVTGADTYSHGEEVTLTATANEGYKFVNWTENDTVVSTEAEYSFVITGDRNLAANFELLTYEVVASVNIENAGEITGAGIYGYGEEVTLTATANEGYKFVNWTENGEVVSEEAEYSFEITKDRNLVANFELLSYNVTASLNPENAGVVNGAGTYNHGEEVTLTATANEGYRFINWTENGEVVSEEAEYSFVITSDRNLVANFELLTYEVKTSVNIENAGEITGDGNYNHGDTVALIATANEGYAFVNWTEDGEVISSVAEYSFVILKDRNIVANFEKLENPEQPEEPGEGVEEHETSFNIYPNPVSDKLYIETQTQTQTVEIYDVYGRRQSMVNGQQSTVIDVSDLNSGVYFVKVVTSEGEVVKRFIKD